MKGGKVKEKFFWGANQDELLCENDNRTLCDHLNTVRKLVGQGGKVLEHRVCDAFGNVTKRSGDASCFFGFTGKYFDEAAQLQWSINRWYDAQVGRWISEDPIGFGDQDTNIAVYVHNNPLLYTDFSGLWAWTIEGDRHIFTAESGDTFESLVVFISSLGYGSLNPAKRKYCIRPHLSGLSQIAIVKMKQAWRQFKPHICGNMMRQA